MKFFLFVLAALLAVAFAAPKLTIDRITVLSEDDVEIEDNTKGLDLVDLESADRAPTEVAVYAAKSGQAGYARTTNVGITVQKGTSGELRFKIRAKAVTVEQLAELSADYEKSLTASEKHSLSILKEDWDGDYDIPWLHSLGIDLKKGFKKADLDKEWQKQIRYNERALVAQRLLKEVQVQRIEIEGRLTAYGVSFIPTTVFSFLKIARINFADGSHTTVVSKHPGNLVAATHDGSQTVPSDNSGIEIIDI